MLFSLKPDNDKLSNDVGNRLSGYFFSLSLDHLYNYACIALPTPHKSGFNLFNHQTKATRREKEHKNQAPVQLK